MDKKDVAVIRELAGRVGEIAALPVQEEKRALWRSLNACKGERPMVLIDQICWNEMNVDDELTMVCSDKVCRIYEAQLRGILYRWKHFPVDMVVEPFLDIPMAVNNTVFGVSVETENAVVSDPTSDVISRRFGNQLETEEDLEKVQTPQVTHDPAKTERRMAIAHELFDGLLEVRPGGVDPYLSLWDIIATWMGVQNALYALMDKPDFMHRLLDRMTNGFLSMLDQYEALGVLCRPQSLIHCTGAYTDELPAPGYDPEKPRTEDIWMFGLAQMLGTVSPKMYKEFEIDYVTRICERFGQVYYGCCEPLDGKMNEVRMLPNVRKVSMSPWVDLDRGAAEIGGDYVFSRKPNPAFLAGDRFHPDQVREDLLATRQACEAHGCSVEFILKDISTVRYQPERLSEWARIAMEVARG